MARKKSNAAQLRSRSYLLPVEDTAFLLRDEMRSIRFALEYGKAELLLRDWGIRSTVVVFGSARIPSPEQAADELQRARGADQTAAARRRCDLSHWYTEARRFGRIVSQLARCRYERALSVDIRDIPDAAFPMAPEVRKLKYLLESLV